MNVSAPPPPTVFLRLCTHLVDVTGILGSQADGVAGIWVEVGWVCGGGGVGVVVVGRGTQLDASSPQ